MLLLCIKDPLHKIVKQGNQMKKQNNVGRNWCNTRHPIDLPSFGFQGSCSALQIVRMASIHLIFALLINIHH